MNFKFIVTPTISIAEYHLRELNINKKDISLVYNVETARGRNFTKENTLVLMGEEFGYPEAAVNTDRFYEVLEIVNRRIELNLRVCKSNNPNEFGIFR